MLLRAEKALLVQMNTKVLTVFSSPPPTYFSPRKVIQLFLIKAIISQQVPFPHCLVPFMRKKKKKQDAQKSLTHEFLQNDQFLDEKQLESQKQIYRKVWLQYL